MNYEVDDFKSELKSELLSALGRETQVAIEEQASAGPERSRVLMAVAASMLVLVGLAASSLFFGATPVEAETFEVTPLPSSLRLDVIDIVASEEAASAELQDAGIDAEFFRVPVHPDLVGSIVSVGAESTIEPEIEVDVDGLVAAVVLPSDFAGRLFIEYGVSGDEFVATIPDEICAELRGLSFPQAKPLLDTYVSSLRFEIVQPDGSAQADVSVSEIDDGLLLISIERIGVDTAIATFGSSLSSESVHPNCLR